MDLLKYDAGWFRSKAGCNAFESLKSLEDRSIFLYSYLKNIAGADFDADQTLFKIAFFMADGILGSSLPYSSYPDIIDPAKNPFITYLDNAVKYPGASAVYFIFLSILHGLVEPERQNEWIYHEDVDDPEFVEKILDAMEKEFYTDNIKMASADAYAIEESLQLVQLKLIWLFGQS